MREFALSGEQRGSVRRDGGHVAGLHQQVGFSAQIHFGLQLYAEARQGRPPVLNQGEIAQLQRRGGAQGQLGPVREQREFSLVNEAAERG